MEKMNKTNSWFFEKINKIDKPLTRLHANNELPKKNKKENNPIYNSIKNNKLLRNKFNQFERSVHWKC